MTRKMYSRPSALKMGRSRKRSTLSRRSSYQLASGGGESGSSSGVSGRRSASVGGGAVDGGDGVSPTMNGRRPRDDSPSGWVPMSRWTSDSLAASAGSSGEVGDLYAADGVLFPPPPPPPPPSTGTSAIVNGARRPPGRRNRPERTGCQSEPLVRTPAQSSRAASRGRNQISRGAPSAMLAAIALCLSAGALPARHAPPARLIAAHRACGRAGRPALAAPNGRVTRVESVMTRDVVSLTREQSLVDAMEIFVRRRISGAPVVDDSGQLCGMCAARPPPRLDRTPI